MADQARVVEPGIVKRIEAPYVKAINNMDKWLHEKVRQWEVSPGPPALSVVDVLRGVQAELHGQAVEAYNVNASKRA